MYMLIFIKRIIGICWLLLITACSGETIITENISSNTLSDMNTAIEKPQWELAYFAGGCFWCIEWVMDWQEGVYSAISGYMGWEESDANYQKVSSGNTAHREWVRVDFDPNKVSYRELVELFFRQIDPLDAGGQFADRGFHYTTAVYYTDATQRNIVQEYIQELDNSGKFDSPIVVKVEAYESFYKAEEYHQDYAKKQTEKYKKYAKWSGRKDYIENTWENNTKDVSMKSLEERLTPLEYSVTQENWTERAFSHEYNENKEDWIYVDIIDGTPLFSSTHKYDSWSWWPSFTQPINDTYISKHEDRKLFSVRTEVRSKKADSHLGHVFPDGPEDKGWLRYCINWSALTFIPDEDLEEKGYGEYSELFK